MFYSQLVLAKKGPLSQVWLAAHSNNFKKLTKADVSNADILKTVGEYFEYVKSVSNVKHLYCSPF